MANEEAGAGALWPQAGPQGLGAGGEMAQGRGVGRAPSKRESQAASRLGQGLGLSTEGETAPLVDGGVARGEQKGGGKGWEEKRRKQAFMEHRPLDLGPQVSLLI